MRKIKTDKYTVYRAANLDALAKLKDSSVHVCVSDVPYGLSDDADAVEMLKAWSRGKDYKHKDKTGYFGAEWDAFVPQPSLWREVYRVLKPGGWCLAFFGARTYDVGTLSMRMAGFEVRDCIQWIYGISSPRNHRMDRAIDRKKGVDIKKHYTRKGNFAQTKEAKQWTGWGTNLRPCAELIALCRKPPEKGSIVENVLKHGIGALNIEAARIPLSDAFAYDAKQARKRVIPIGTMHGRTVTNDSIPYLNEAGRFPSHLLLDEESGKVLDSTSPNNEISRFFYQPKVSQAEREWGTAGLELKTTSATKSTIPLMLRKSWEGDQRTDFKARNNHPTVKPVALMRYLVRLVAPHNAIVLDPYMGSGSTGIAAILEGCRFVGMEDDKEFFKIAKTRIAFAKDIVENHPADKMKSLFG